MSINPGILDANVLVYAMDADAPHHKASRALLDAALDQSATLYVTSQILCEFYSIVTNARRVPRPRTCTDAVDVIEKMLSFLRVLPVPADSVKGWLDLLRSRPVIGPDVFDLQLVAVMLANNVKIIYTYNASDFQPFPELTVKEP